MLNWHCTFQQLFQCLSWTCLCKTCPGEPILYHIERIDHGCKILAVIDIIKKLILLDFTVNLLWVRNEFCCKSGIAVWYGQEKSIED